MDRIRNAPSPAEGLLLRRLAVQQLEYLEIIEIVPLLLLIMNPAGEILFANLEAQRSLDSESMDLVGRSVFSLVAAAERARLVDAFERRVLPTAGENIELTVRFKGQRDGKVELLAVRDIDFDDARAVVLVARDVTERRALELQVVLSERLRTLGTLAGGLAHEINNPLAVVIANLSFVLEAISELPGVGQPVLGQMQEALEEATEATTRIKGIVKDMGSFARGDPDAANGVDVAATVAWALSLMRPRISPGFQVETALLPTPHARGARAKLSQVLVNLIMNACDAMKEGPRKGLLRISSRCDLEGNVVLEVEDNGHGIPAALLPRIFEPFFTTRGVGGGVGLGLSVAFGLIRSMGGSIAVQSVEDSGSTFRITLPPAVGQLSSGNSSSTG